MYEWMHACIDEFSDAWVDAQQPITVRHTLAIASSRRN